MSAFTVLLVFLFTWWLVLFIVLPFGVDRNENPEKGHNTGAPSNPWLKRKIIITTAVAILLVFLFFYLTNGMLISPDIS